jgi:hypothetical protein
MSDLRTAAQQALKSLRGYRRELWCQQPCDAERALEAALEARDGGEVKWFANGSLMDNPRAALEQPEQEPVATVAMDVSGAHLSWNGQYLGQRPDMKIAMLLKDLPVGTLLYAHPPRREWRGLTKEEISDIFEADPRYHYPPICATDREFARAIEAALKEKNHE